MRSAFRSLGIIAALSGWAAAASAQISSADLPPAGRTIIEHVTVVSPEREAPLEDVSVVIQNDRIIAIADGDIPPEPGDALIDGRGRFLTPGLIDGHVHLTVVPGIPVGPPAGERQRQMVEAYRLQVPLSYLYFGFTTLVDVASFPEDLERFRAAPLRPDFLSCAAMPVVGGYPLVFMPLEDPYAWAPSFIVDPARPDAVPPGYDATEHSPDAAVRRAQADGHACVKLFVEDGFGEANAWPIPSDATLAAVTAEADRLGMPVFMHANAIDMQSIALRGGADVLAHGLWNWNESAGADEPTEAVRRHLDAVAASGVDYMPTQRVMAGTAEMWDPAFDSDSTLGKVMPAEFIEWYATEESNGFRDMLVQQNPALADPETARQIMSGVTRQGAMALAYLLERDGNVLFGSDTPADPAKTHVPGYSGFKELRLLEAAGMTPREILAAATIRNARVFGLEDELGTIEPGRIANLLLLAQNPLERIEAYDSIEAVILRGHVLDRETLAADRKVPALCGACR